MLLLIVGAGWLTREKWLKIVPGARARGDSSPARASAPERTWQPLSPEAGARGRRAIDGLASSRGPVFVNLAPDEIASYVVQAAGGAFPGSADSVEAAVIGDVLYVRAIVPTKDIAGSGVLGPLAGLLNERERVSLGGSFHVIRPGLSAFELRDVKLRDVSVPRAAIPRLVKQITKGKTTPGVPENALPVPTPKSLADVRIANGRVTLYKTTAGATAIP
ncbi:MAG: hypothetical protein M3Z10_14550 [Gemmatimonadota bacterium]|nr:hypothetical protein [Gemmatimonadota bacterium]